VHAQPQTFGQLSKFIFEQLNGVKDFESAVSTEETLPNKF